MGMDANRGNGWTAVDWAKLAGVAVVGGLGLSALGKAMGTAGAIRRGANPAYKLYKGLENFRATNKSWLEAEAANVKSVRNGIGGKEKAFKEWMNQDATQYFINRQGGSETIARGIWHAEGGIKRAEDLASRLWEKNGPGAISWLRGAWNGESGPAQWAMEAMGKRAEGLLALTENSKGEMLSPKELLANRKAARDWYSRGFSVNRHATGINRAAMLGAGYLAADFLNPWGFGSITD